MKVVGHPAPGQESDGDKLTGRGEQFDEGGVVGLLAKDSAAGIAAIEDVIAAADLRSASGAWHARHCD
jgi:hypothetical protein